MTIHMTSPLIEEARVKISGTSAESFEMPEIGEERTYTVKAVCTTHTEQDMASEGTRRTVTMKMLKIVEGVSKKIHDSEDGQGSLLDGDGKAVDPDEGQEPDDPDAEHPQSTFVGPQFSGGDE